MIKIHRFDVSIHEYYRRGKSNLFPELLGCPHPNCNNHDRLRKHGFYSRRVITPRFVVDIWIQRYFCPVCKHTVSLLPSFCAPWFQLTTSSVFWILHRLHGLNLSMRQVVSLWQARGHTHRLARQHIQFLQRRLRHNDRVYRLFLGVDVDGEIGAHLSESLRVFQSAPSLAEAFYKAWQRPFLARL